MVEIPELSKEETQKIASEMFVGILVGTGAYIRQKLGPKAEDEPGRNVYKRWVQDDDNRVIRKLLFT